MTTTTKIVVGSLAAVAVGGLVYMYVNKKGMFKSAIVVVEPAGEAGADGTISRKKGSTPVERRYPPHIYVKGKGYTDWQGKLI